MITEADRIKITAQIAVLKEIALEYNGKTIEHYPAVRDEIGRLNLKQLKS